MPVLTGDRWAEIRRAHRLPTRWWASRLGTIEDALDRLRPGEAIDVLEDPSDVLTQIAEKGHLRRRGAAEITIAHDALVELRQDQDPAAVLLRLVVDVTRILGGPRVVAAVLDAGLVPEGPEGRAAIRSFRREAP